MTFLLISNTAYFVITLHAVHLNFANIYTSESTRLKAIFK